MPGQATNAPPGTARKVRVLMERAARREPLFHPGDNNVRPLPIPANAAADEPDLGNEFDFYDVDLAG